MARAQRVDPSLRFTGSGPVERARLRTLARMPPIDPADLRANSVAVAASYGLEILERLPLLEHEELERPRDPIDVVERCWALDSVLRVVHGNAQAGEVLSELEEGDRDGGLAADERAFLEATRDGKAEESERVEISWRVEAMLSMAWALGATDQLQLEGIANDVDEIVDRLDPKTAAFRPIEEIATQLDLLYCLHWVIRERDLTGEPATWPEALEPGAIWERRHGLEWIFQSEAADWDDVDLST